MVVSTMWAVDITCDWVGFTSRRGINFFGGDVADKGFCDDQVGRGRSWAAYGWDANQAALCNGAPLLVPQPPNVRRPARIFGSILHHKASDLNELYNAQE